MSLFERSRPTWILVSALALLALWWVFGQNGLDLARGPADQLSVPAAERANLLATALLGSLASLGLLKALPAWTALRPAPWRFALGVSAVALLLLLGIRFGLQADVPVSDDEWGYLFQARTFALGRLTVPPLPPLPHFDYTFLVVHDGRWFCNFQPGLAGLMAVGLWLGLGPALPVLAVSATLPALCYGLGRALSGERAGRAAALLSLGSPWFLLTGAQLEPYAPLAVLTAACALILVALTRASGRAIAGWSLSLGTLLGLALLLRGLEFGLLGLGLAGTQLARLAMGLRRPGQRRALLGRLALESGLVLLAMAPFVGLQLAYNQGVSGDPWLLPLSLPRGPTSFFGFGPEVYNHHSLLKGLSLWGTNLGRVAVWLVGAPVLLLALALRPRAPGVRPILLFGLIFWLGWLPRPLGGIADFGPVYLFAFAPLLVVALASAAAELPHQLLERGTLAAIITGALGFGAFSALRLGAITEAVSAPYQGQEALGKTPPGRHLVLVRRHFPAPTGWVFGVPLPDPLLQDPVIFAWATPQDQRPAVQAALSQALPGRAIHALTIPGEKP